MHNQLNKDSRKKILMIITSLEMSSGVTTFVMNYLESLHNAGYQVDVLNLRKEENPEFEKNTEAVKALGGEIFTIGSWKHPVKVFRQTQKIIRSGDYQIVHNNSLLPAIPVMFWACAYRVPVRIFHSHNAKLAQTPAKEARNKFFLPLLRMISNRFAACSGKAGEAVFNTQYDVIPNAIEISAFRYDEKARNKVRSKMGLEGKEVVLCVGRLCEQKNVLFALSCFEQLSRINPKAVLIWAGGGELKETADQWVHEHGLEEKIRLLGDCSDVKSLYSSADLFFLPSLFEGLPLTAIEAQAEGLPCLLSDTISDEVKCLNRLQFYPLEKSPAQWAQQMNQMIRLSENRDLCNQQMETSRYSLTESRKFLPRLYGEYLRG